MADDPKLEIPLPVRQIAEQNVEQARAAYSQFVDMARKAADMMGAATQGTTGGMQQLQTRAMRFAEQNADAGFNFASDLARARTIQEYMEIQQRFAQRQMQSFTEQAQEIGKLMTEAAQKPKP